jgi:hypothetical protein
MSRKSMYLLCCMTGAILLMVGVLATPNYSRQIQTQSAVDVPILKLTCSDGHWARTPILNGQQLDWQIDSTKTTFSFTPEVIDGEKSVRVKVEKAGPDGKRETLETFKLSIGVPAVASAKSPFKIEIESPRKTDIHASVKRVSYAVPTVSTETASPGFFAQCCVRCDGTTVCANCFVSMDCGCCCTGVDACCGFCQ